MPNTVGLLQVNERGGNIVTPQRNKRPLSSTAILHKSLICFQKIVHQFYQQMTLRLLLVMAAMFFCITQIDFTFMFLYKEKHLTPKLIFLNSNIT